MNKLFYTVILFTALIFNGYTNDNLHEHSSENEQLQNIQTEEVNKEQNNTYYNLLSSGLSSVSNLIGNGLHLVPNIIKGTYNLVSNYYTTNSDTNKTVRILSLDVGGTRVYSQAKFLEYFCKNNKIDNLNEYFDFIAGSSAGSLIAVAIANGIKPADFATFCREKTPWIFTRRSWCDTFSNNASYPSNKPSFAKKLYLGLLHSQPFYKSVSEDSNYGDARLRRELTDIFGDRTLTSLKTNVLLLAHNYSEHAPVVFTNVNINNKIPDAFKEIKIVDAVMGSVSAPTYFPSTNLKLSPDPKEPAYKIIDGALFQCNPSTLAYATAQMLYPTAKNYSILSLSTGENEMGLHVSSEADEPSNIALMQFIKLWDIGITNAGIANDLFFKALSSNKNSKVSYYNFNYKLDTNIDYELDTTTDEFFDYLDAKVSATYQIEKEKIQKFVNESK